LVQSTPTLLVQDSWCVPSKRQLRGVHLPADLQPDPATEGSVSIYNADAGPIWRWWAAWDWARLPSPWTSWLHSTP